MTSRSAVRPPKRRFLGLVAAVLVALQPALPVLAAGGTSGCGPACCCAGIALVEPPPARGEGGCCSEESVAARPTPPAHEAREGASCGCRFARGDESLAAPAAPLTSERCAGQEGLAWIVRATAHSAHTPLAEQARAGPAPTAHAPPRGGSTDPPRTPGPWRDLARRGMDALLAGLGVALR